MTKLYCGDCIDIMSTLPERNIDMILCDLPYGTTRNKWDEIVPLEPMWKAYKRLIKPGGAICLFSQLPFTCKLVESNPKWFRYEWIWEKPNARGFLNAGKMPLRAHESILVFYDKLPTYNPQKTYGHENYRKTNKESRKTASYGDFDLMTTNICTDGSRFPRDVIRFGVHEKRVHPTQKPVELLEYLIKTYTNEGETVLDNCMGSGSTGVACVNTGRNFIGIEKDKEWFDYAKSWIEQVKNENIAIP